MSSQRVLSLPKDVQSYQSSKCKSKHNETYASSISTITFFFFLKYYNNQASKTYGATWTLHVLLMKGEVRKKKLEKCFAVSPKFELCVFYDPDLLVLNRNAYMCSTKDIDQSVDA